MFCAFCLRIPGYSLFRDGSQNGVWFHESFERRILAINKAAVPVLKHQEGDAIWLVSVKCNKTVKMHLTKYPTFLQTLSQLIKKNDNPLAK